MNRIICCAAILMGLVFANHLLASVAVEVSDYNGTRSTGGNGITGFGLWSGAGDAGFQISWNIEDLGGGNWSYKYTISGVTPTSATSLTNLDKELSHWILQITDDVDIGDFSKFSLDPTGNMATTYDENGPGKSNPGIPGSIYGFKWDVPDGEPASTWMTSFESTHAPVWGDFYAKDGKTDMGTADVYAYNTGFGTSPDEDTKDFTNWIARPNGVDGGPPAIPEPATVIAWALLLPFGAAAVWMRRRRS